jgi:adenine-specific DNA-methyltransferase
VESAARSLGAYYTPTLLATPLCRWAVRRSDDTLFDPSCGEGAFLTHGVDRLLELGAEPRRLSDQIAGVELNARALARARGALLSRHPGLRWGRLAQDDFFLFVEENLGRFQFDVVLGNPPFLRTQGRSEASKRRALRVAHACGTALTADASAWAPFVAASAAFVRPGGRLAMLVPREALFVNYTKPLLAMLEKRFARVNLIALDGYWFDGAMVKVAMLLCEGVGPGVLRLHEARSLDGIEALTDAAPTEVPAPSWVWSRIPEDCRPAAGRALESPELLPLTGIADVSIGIVTGERDFFLLPQSSVRGLGLPREHLSRAVSRPSHLAGTNLTRDDIAGLDREGEPTQLLTIPSDYAGGCSSLDGYLAAGIGRGIDRNYKCRTRKPWFSVKRVLEPPHAFLGYLVKRRLRLAANEAAVNSTNNLHRIWFESPWDQVAEVVAAGSMNAATMLSVEVLGRISAAGALKIEPGDASKIRLVRPEQLLKVKGARGRAGAIDRALREGRDPDAFRMADDWASRALGWNPREFSRLRRAQMELRDARLRTDRKDVPGTPGPAAPGGLRGV